MSRARVLVSGLLALMLLAGCGKRGPLYLPGDEDEPASQQETPERSQPPNAPGY